MLENLNQRPNSSIIQNVPPFEGELDYYSSINQSSLPQLTQNRENDKTQQIEKSQATIANQISQKNLTEYQITPTTQLDKLQIFTFEPSRQLTLQNQRNQGNLSSNPSIIIQEILVSKQNDQLDKGLQKCYNPNFTSKNELEKKKSITQTQNLKSRIYQYCSCQKDCQYSKCICRREKRKCKNGCKCIPKLNTCNNPFQNEGNNREYPRKIKKFN